MLWSTSGTDSTASFPGARVVHRHRLDEPGVWKEETQVNQTLHLQVCRGATGSKVSSATSDPKGTGLRIDHLGSPGLFLMEHVTQDTVPAFKELSPKWGDSNPWGQAVVRAESELLQEFGSQDREGSKWMFDFRKTRDSEPSTPFFNSVYMVLL